MSIIPVEVPTGAIRYNTDSNKMECFNGTKWYEVSVTTPDLDGGARAVFPGGHAPPAATNSNVIDFVTISSQGNAADFGDLDGSDGRAQCAGFSSRTRGCIAGGENPGIKDTIDYFTMSSKGNSLDFGTLLASNRAFSGNGFANATRGFTAGGYTAPSYTDTIQYVTIASTGNAVDFGNMTWTGATCCGALTSPTRGLIAGGSAPSSSEPNTIQLLTLTTLGNAEDFGDLSVGRDGVASASNATRGIWAGGSVWPALYNVIDYVEIATLGNAMDFGDTNTTSRAAFGASSPTRAVWAGGYGAPNGSTSKDDIDYNTIATRGNSVDFGNLTQARGWSQASSTGHGGL